MGGLVISLINLFKNLLSTCYISNAILGTGDRKINKIDNLSVFKGFIFSWGSSSYISLLEGRGINGSVTVEIRKGLK